MSRLIFFLLLLPSFVALHGQAGHKASLRLYPFNLACGNAKIGYIRSLNDKLSLTTSLAYSPVAYRWVGSSLLSAETVIITREFTYRMGLMANAGIRFALGPVKGEMKDAPYLEVLASLRTSQGERLNQFMTDDYFLESEQRVIRRSLWGVGGIVMVGLPLRSNRFRPDFYLGVGAHQRWVLTRLISRSWEPTGFYPLGEFMNPKKHTSEPMLSFHSGISFYL